MGWTVHLMISFHCNINTAYTKGIGHYIFMKWYDEIFSRAESQRQSDFYLCFFFFTTSHFLLCLCAFSFNFIIDLCRQNMYEKKNLCVSTLNMRKERRTKKRRSNKHFQYFKRFHSSTTIEVNVLMKKNLSNEGKNADFSTEKGITR